MKSFEIIGLSNYKDIFIPFDGNIKILVGENGTGKTTLLNILYYTISCRFDKLSEYTFKSIKLRFYTDEVVELNAEDLINEDLSIKLTSNYIANQIINNNSDKYLTSIKDQIYENYIEALFKEKIIESQRSKRFKSKYKAHKDKLEKATKIIKKYFPDEILYFPTYRRIEEELHNLGFKRDIDFKKDDNLIQFGMEDVEELFRSITSEIKDSTIQSYTQITTNMINHLVIGHKASNEMKENLRKSSSLNIILDRIADKLDFNPNEIEKLIETEQIFKDGVYDPLIYFLSNLIDNYEMQRDKDVAIKQFEKVCNKYLQGKKVIYNETLVKIEILDDYNKKPVQLSKLSSGEKQIVSLFSKIYLRQINDFIVLFDEPELSLSIEWQTLLLPDIINSGKCKFLFSVTHSPFIYDNELDDKATGINVFTKIKLSEEMDEE